jgi:hypothetical protein
MSRMYAMTIMVDGHDKSRYEAIVDAVVSLGYDADADLIGAQIVFSSEVINLGGGCSDEAAAKEIHQAIWAANGAFCDVQVGMRDLDAEIPTYLGSESQYEEWLATRNKTS